MVMAGMATRRCEPLGRGSGALGAAEGAGECAGAAPWGLPEGAGAGAGAGARQGRQEPRVPGLARVATADHTRFSASFHVPAAIRSSL